MIYPWIANCLHRCRQPKACSKEYMNLLMIVPGLAICQLKSYLTFYTIFVSSSTADVSKDFRDNKIKPKMSMRISKGP